MAEVVGGNTKSMPGRLAEVAGWFPVLSALVLAGGASLLDANNMMPVTLPDWADSALNLYRGARDQAVEATLGKTIGANYADLAVGAVALVTMMSRKVLGFAPSIIGFGLLALAGWWLLSKFA